MKLRNERVMADSQNFEELTRKRAEVELVETENWGDKMGEIRTIK